MATMKAVRVHEFGGPDVLKYEDAERPTAAEGQVLVRIYGSSVNPIDWKARAGHLEGWIDYTLPFIPGWDLAGEIEEVGENVTGFSKGDAVYANADIRKNGTYAQYIATDARLIAPKPQSLDFAQAAAVPLAGMTAWQALFDHGGLQPGQTVLIHAAAGGVGSFAVQLAKWKGARVIGTASTPESMALLGELGVDEVIDYKKTPFENAVKDVDMVLDSIGGDVQQRSWQVLKPGGILVSILGKPDEAEASNYGVRGTNFLLSPSGALLVELGRLIDEGRVRPIIETVLPLQEVARAQEMGETGHTRGKIALQVD